MIETQTILLNDGHRLPRIGLGTWPMDDAQAAVAVESALRHGYRLIDTAARYLNEKGVGLGAIASGVPREEIVLTTKLRGCSHGYDNTLRAFDESLKRFGMEYLDLYLIHWPQPMKNLYVETWKAFVRLKEEGRVRSIGVSNFLPAHIDRLVQETGVWPAVNQMELHPDFAQVELRQWLVAKGIAVQSWSPLGIGAELRNPVIQGLATKHQRTPAQVILRWHLQLGFVAVPKSQNLEHIQQNFDLGDFNLDQSDLDAIAALNNGQRLGGDPATLADD